MIRPTANVTRRAMSSRATGRADAEERRTPGQAADPETQHREGQEAQEQAGRERDDPGREQIRQQRDERPATKAANEPNAAVSGDPMLRSSSPTSSKMS